jgi:hypothetical protein
MAGLARVFKGVDPGVLGFDKLANAVSLSPVPGNSLAAGILSSEYQ